MAGVGHALEQALAYYRAPALLARSADRALPDDVLDILRLAAGDEVLTQQSAAASGETPAVVVEAAIFFIQQVLFAPGADSHRVLGVNANAPEARIKEHYRWLVRWLHPDRNLDEWDSVYAERVNRAWQDLRRRPAGTAPLTADPLPATAAGSARIARINPGPTFPRISHESPAVTFVSPRTVQRLPVLVLGALGLLAVSTLALMWYVQDPASSYALGAPAPSSEPEPDLPFGGSDAMAELADTTLRELPAPAPAPPPALPPGDPPAVTLTSPAGIPDVVVPVPRVESRDPAPILPAAVATTAPAPAAVPATSPAPAPARATAPPTKVGSARTNRTAKSAAKDTPPTPVVTDAPDSPSTERIDEQAAGAVLSRFTTAYSGADVRSLMRLFTRDATNNRGGRDAIAYDYQSLFKATTERELILSRDAWIASEGSGTFVARYVARVNPRGIRPMSESQGVIRFDFAYEDGDLKIKRIRHDIDAR